MDKYELIALITGLAIFMGFMFTPVIMAANCRTEAVKAGMPAADIPKACNQR